ncbi:MAG: hypothetical protein Q8R25_02590 [bacterium]|nr:hypothetical protein [bacterium]
MIGILLAGLSSAFGELSDSIGKKEVRERVASFYTFGFLNLLAGTILLIAFGIYRDAFVFSLASLPTFLPRVALEILQAHMTLRAIVKAERSDFGFIRSVTIPLILIVDLILGYTVTIPQMFGIFVIFSGIFFLFYAEHFHIKAKWLLLGTAVNAVATISLYKYDVTHFNSVESEQVIVSLVVMLYLFVMAIRSAKENPLSFLRNPFFATQSIASGLAIVVGSYAILFAPASVITAALRATAVLFSIISGRFYFKERKFALKSLLFVFIVVGIVLLAR